MVLIASRTSEMSLADSTWGRNSSLAFSHDSPTSDESQCDFKIVSQTWSNDRNCNPTSNSSLSLAVPRCSDASCADKLHATHQHQGKAGKCQPFPVHQTNHQGLQLNQSSEIRIVCRPGSRAPGHFLKLDLTEKSPSWFHWIGQTSRKHRETRYKRCFNRCSKCHSFVGNLTFVV